MKPRAFDPVVLVVGTAVSLLTACGIEPEAPAPTPFTGAQLDRITAGVRAAAPTDGRRPEDEPPPLWVSQELMDDDTRLVVHVRLPVSGALEDVPVHQVRCGRLRKQMQEYLLPGQKVEVYLVFDNTVHACRDAG